MGISYITRIHAELKVWQIVIFLKKEAFCSVNQGENLHSPINSLLITLAYSSCSLIWKLVQNYGELQRVPTYQLSLFIGLKHWQLFLDLSWLYKNFWELDPSLTCPDEYFTSLNYMYFSYLASYAARICLGRKTTRYHQVLFGELHPLKTSPFLLLSLHDSFKSNLPWFLSSHTQQILIIHYSQRAVLL